MSASISIARRHHAARHMQVLLAASVLAVAALVALGWHFARDLTSGTGSTNTAPVAPMPGASRHPKAAMPESARRLYALTWGVDQMSTKLAESGQVVRFNYRVLDATKAAPLNSRGSIPYLLDEEAGVVLQVPNMEKVGPLRQSTSAIAGKTYWMVFSNKGNFVKAGHRVSVVIGPFRVDGLIVQ